MKHFLLFCLLLFCVGFGKRVDGLNEPKSNTLKDTLLVVFYNMENLFDCNDDPGDGDDDFLPWKGRYWTPRKLKEKINHVSKALVAAGELPAIIGLCEVENQAIIKKLVFGGPLKSVHYSFLHHESPDHRGIDVALLYRPEYFKILNYKFIPIKEGEKICSTREVLYVRGLLGQKDTLDFFVNHWPSLYGGRKPSARLRSCVAHCLHQVMDTITPIKKCIVMGDFNVEPQDSTLLLFSSMDKDNQKRNLKFFPYNNSAGSEVYGTTRFRDQWRFIDQFWVTEAWEQRFPGGYYPDEAFIVAAPFLLEDDPTWPGVRPNRSYVGFRYHGGFSDHLPIALRLVINSFGE